MQGADPAGFLYRPAYTNGALIGSHVPGDAAALLAATDFEAYVRIKNDDPIATSTRYVDDVRITPAE